MEEVITKKLDTSDFFEKKKTETKPTEMDNVPVDVVVKSATDIPAEYIKVVFDSLGKLGTPEILHFRNYKLEEVMNLATVSTEDGFLKKLIYVLNQMVWEEFDCANLHEKDLEIIMLTLYSTFWGKNINSFEYTYEEEEKDEDGFTSVEEKKAFASIPISSIKTKPLNSEFKEPIKIKGKEHEVKFRLLRMKDIIFTNTYIDRVFSEKKRFFSDYEVERQTKLNTKKEEQYQNYIEARGNLSLKVLEALLIEELDGNKTETIEQKLEAFDKLDINYWVKYNKVVEEYADFGVQSEVEFFSPELGGLTTRSFPFQFVDFLPTLELQNDSDYTVSFGD